MRTKQYPRSATYIPPFVDVGCTPTLPGRVVDAEPYFSTPLNTSTTAWPSHPAAIHHPLPSPSGSPFLASPPPLDHSRSPYATISLPSQLPNEEGDPIVHPILERGSTLLAMHWDVRTSPLAAFTSVNYLLHGRQQSRDRRGTANARHWQYQPATFPALDSLVIRTTFLGDKPLVVFPTSNKHHAVTVMDVLDAVHRAVRLERVVDGDEQTPSLLGDESVGASGRARAVERFRGRRPETRPETGFAHSHGCLWGGLTPSPTERDVWILLLQ